MNENGMDAAAMEARLKRLNIAKWATLVEVALGLGVALTAESLFGVPELLWVGIALALMGAVSFVVFHRLNQRIASKGGTARDSAVQRRNR